MSVKVMSWVWDHSKTRGNDRLVLLAIADSADHDGTNAFPAIETLMRKTGLSRRSVQRSIRNTEQRGELRIELNAGLGHRPDRRSNMFTVLMDGTPRSSSEAERGARLTPRDENGAPNTTERGAKYDRTGRHTDALSVLDPSLEPSLDSKHASASPSASEGGRILEALRAECTPSDDPEQDPSRLGLAAKQLRGWGLRDDETGAVEILARVFELSKGLSSGGPDPQCPHQVLGRPCSTRAPGAGLCAGRRGSCKQGTGGTVTRSRRPATVRTIRRGVTWHNLGLLALGALANGPRFEREILESIEAATGIVVAEPNLCREMPRLRSLGLVEFVEDGTDKRRRTYRITRKGTEVLADQVGGMQGFVASLVKRTLEGAEHGR